jgi:hypothetical protein
MRPTMKDHQRPRARDYVLGDATPVVSSGIGRHRRAAWLAEAIGGDAD